MQGLAKKSKCNCCEMLLLRYNKLRRVYEFIKKVGEIKRFIFCIKDSIYKYVTDDGMK